MKEFLIILFWCTSFFSLIFQSITVKKDSLLSGYNNVELEILDDDIEVSINTREQKNLFEYFYNLDTSLGDNISNICVPVAFGMILSYYDTYFNDDIIPEEYEVNSYCYNDDFEDYLNPNNFEHINTMEFSTPLSQLQATETKEIIDDIYDFVKTGDKFTDDEVKIFNKIYLEKEKIKDN